MTASVAEQLARAIRNNVVMVHHFDNPGCPGVQSYFLGESRLQGAAAIARALNTHDRLPSRLPWKYRFDPRFDLEMSPAMLAGHYPIALHGSSPPFPIECRDEHFGAATEYIGQLHRWTGTPAHVVITKFEVFSACDYDAACYHSRLSRKCGEPLVRVAVPTARGDMADLLADVQFFAKITVDVSSVEHAAGCRNTAPGVNTGNGGACDLGTCTEKTMSRVMHLAFVTWLPRAVPAPAGQLGGLPTIDLRHAAPALPNCVSVGRFRSRVAALPTFHATQGRWVEPYVYTISYYV